MTFEQTETAVDAFRGQGAPAREPLSPGYLDDMASAASEYREAKRELLALTSTQASEEALMAATQRLASARLAVKRAIRV
jgi:hypothetical protein